MDVIEGKAAMDAGGTEVRADIAESKSSVVTLAERVTSEGVKAVSTLIWCSGSFDPTLRC